MASTSKFNTREAYLAPFNTVEDFLNTREHQDSLLGEWLEAFEKAFEPDPPPPTEYFIPHPPYNTLRIAA